MTDLAATHANAVNDYIFRGTAPTAGERWLAVFTSAWVECTGDGYARVDLDAFLGTATGGDNETDTLIEWDPLDSTDDIDITHIAVMDDETTGAYVIRKPLGGTVSVAAGQPLSIPIGDLTTTVDPAA